MPARGLDKSNHHHKEHGTGRGHYFQQVSIAPISPPPDQPNPPAPPPGPPPAPPPGDMTGIDGGQELADFEGFF